MLAYLIEDDTLKASHLKTFLAVQFPQLRVKVFGSYQSGLRAIENIPPSVVLLDMTLPTFDRTAKGREGRNRPLGGYDLMRKLQLHGIAPSVIIVTQLDNFGEGDEQVTFAEISARCAGEFPSFYAGSVHFEAAEADWKLELAELITHVLGNSYVQDINS